MSEPAHLVLRRETRAAHDRVDAVFGTASLARREDYARFLLAHARAFVPVEEALERGGIDRLIGDWPSRRRAGAIRADLAALSLDVPAPEPYSIRDGKPALWGAAYVLEGSRLGGAVLARSIGPGLPAAYLAAGQPGPGAWRKLLASLDESLYVEREIATAVDAALDVFARFEKAGRTELNVDPVEHQVSR